MAGEEVDEEVEAYLEKTKLLAEMHPDDRTKYVIEVIEWLIDQLGWVMESDGMVQMGKRFKRVQQMSVDRISEVTVCALWTVKKDFRSTWMRLLGTLVGMQEEGEEVKSEK